MDPLQELNQAIALLPLRYRAQLRPIVERTKEVARRRKRVQQLIQECLGQLKLDIKYLLFDLDCTRKERDANIQM